MASLTFREKKIKTLRLNVTFKPKYFAVYQLALGRTFVFI
jgi:hypothetical protein